MWVSGEKGAYVCDEAVLVYVWADGVSAEALEDLDQIGRVGVATVIVVWYIILGIGGILGIWEILGIRGIWDIFGGGTILNIGSSGTISSRGFRGWCRGRGHAPGVF